MFSWTALQFVTDIIAADQLLQLDPKVEYSSWDKYFQLPVPAQYIGNDLGVERLRYSFSVQPMRMSSHIFIISNGLGVFVSFTIDFSVYSVVWNQFNNETIS